MTRERSCSAALRFARPLRLLGAAVVALCVVSFVLRARAEEASPVRVRAGAACVNETALRQDVERLLGRRIELALLPERFRVDVDAHAQGDAFVARVALVHQDRVRSVEGETCEAIANAVAIIITIAIDPNAELVESAAPPVQRQPAPAPAPAPAPVPDGPALEFAAELGASVSHGALPGAGGGVDGALGLRYGVFAARARVLYDFAREHAAGTGKLDVDMLGGMLMLGASVEVAPRLRIEAYGLFEFARLAVTTRGFDVNADGAGRWLAFGLDARLTYMIVPWFGLYAGAAVSVPIDRPYFDVVGDAAYRSSMFSVRGALGVTARLPLSR